jgi:hypothetical protein
MNPMRRALRLLLVATVLYGTGAFWSAVQGVAWAGMIASRVQRSTLAEAVRSTFSGTKPCHVCVIADKGASSDQSSSVIRSVPCADFIFVSSPKILSVAAAVPFAVSPDENISFRRSRPSSPPPKRLPVA